MTELMTDISYAIRRLRQRPLMVVVTTASLGLGIGVVTVAFAIANAFLLRAPTHIDSPESLVTVFSTQDSGDPHGQTSFPDYQSLIEHIEGLEDAAATRFGMVSLGEPERSIRPERMLVEIVTGNYFDVLGTKPHLGRTFNAEETRFGAAERIVVISHRVWQDRFAGDPEAIGRSLRLEGDTWTVIGVAPPGVVSRFLPLVVDAWIPVGVPGGVYHATPTRLANRTLRDFTVLGRLAQGATLAQLDSELSVLSDSLHESYGEEWEDEAGNVRSFVALSERDSRLTPSGRAAVAGLVGLLLGGTGLVLFIASSNIACLLLGQASRRQREMAVRVALGANRGRLVTLSLVESLVLAVLGGATGLALAWMATRLVNVVPLPMGMPSLAFNLSLDPKVVGFAVVLSAVTCLFFGMVPAMQGSRPVLIPALKGECTDGRPRRFGPRGLLVVGQMAASLIFVVAAGFLLRSIQELASTDLGFQPDRVAVMSKQLPEDDYSREAALQYFRELRERLAALPEVESAQLSQGLEHSLMTPISAVQIEVPGYERGAGESLVVDHNAVTAGYLEMLGIRPIAGRTLRESDGPSAPGVAVVNQSFADRYWPGGIALGQRFEVAAARATVGEHDARARQVEVVGVVPDGQYTLDGNGGSDSPFLWTSFVQSHSAIVMIHLKGHSSAEAMIPVLVREVETVPGEVSLVSPTTFAELVSMQQSIMEGSSKLVGIAGLFGLALAAIGVHGVVAFAVAIRRRELAIRQALGASPLQVFGIAVADGMILAVAGLGLGLLIALPVVSVLETQLQGVSPLDPLAVGGGCALLLLVALTASAFPALRAAGVDALAALRAE